MSWSEFTAWVTGQGMNLLTVVLKTVIVGAAGYLLITVIMKALTKILETSKLEKAAHSLIKTLAKTVLFILRQWVEQVRYCPVPLFLRK